MANPLKDNDLWRFYGRRIGRKLNNKRQEAVDALLPLLSIHKDRMHKDQSLNPQSLFDKSYNKIILEIGFGNGEHVAEMVRRDEDVGFIGCEPFINGVSALLLEDGIDTAQNLKIHPDDALQLVYSLEDNCLDEIYILNPDPWHKTRHFKRRIVNPDNLNEFSRILKKCGKLILSTDVPSLSEWMLTHTYNHPDFIWQAKSQANWLIPPKDWIPTRYETKQAKGAERMNYYFFEKR